MYITYGNELTYLPIFTIVMTIAGIIFVFFPKILLKLTSDSIMAQIIPAYDKLTPWGLRFFGFMFFWAAYTGLGTGPPRYLYKNENKLSLLESGKIVKARVTKSHFTTGAPKGWQVIYSFETEDPSTKKNKKFLGSSQGPG